MIRVQPTTSGGNRFLVGSDLRDPVAAQREVEDWIADNNCVVPRNSRQLSVFERGVLVREWILVEQKPEPITLPTNVGEGNERPVWADWNRRLFPNATPVRDNVVVLFARAA